jgi:hypothetical protein
MPSKHMTTDEGPERFEAWLSGEDLARARAAMRAAGIRKKSDFVRQRLSRPAGTERASETGEICLSLNEVLLTLQEADQPAAVEARLVRVAELLRLLILARLPDHVSAPGRAPGG